ncbi:hypothetical protein KTD31_00650 [Burkholderia multivorans]|uniref:hypothetical protein n=1 Tax=Burkholderia multivorans TaxID=87883 RepID=UPI001C24F5A1|nr:hypothetical protein [Burkholderia multivorans]MBU9199909.1 hypothetical protein [Burkholderia multivorans]MDN8078972.1 hypothetical protein [Burkholderia multivorans]
MFKQQIIIEVQGETEEALAENIQAAGATLASKSLDDAEFDGGERFTIIRQPVNAKPGYDPNTLYVIGTNEKGDPVIRSFRTSFDAHKDYHIMSSALELSQAVELRGVDFGEHQVGSLVVRPVPKALPPRDAAQVYDLVHITDLVKLDDEDIAYFVKDVPGLIATLKLAKDECDKRGTTLCDVMPKLQYVADSSETVTLNSETQSITAKGADIVAGYRREMLSGS